MTTNLKHPRLPFEYPGTEQDYCFRITKEGQIFKVTYKHYSLTETRLEFKHQGRGTTLKEALDKLVEATSTALGRAYERENHRERIHQFLQVLAMEGFTIS